MDEVLPKTDQGNNSLVDVSISSTKKRVKLTLSNIEQPSPERSVTNTVSKRASRALLHAEESISKAKSLLSTMERTGNDGFLTKEELRQEVRATIGRGVKLICKLISNGLTPEDVEFPS